MWTLGDWNITSGESLSTNVKMLIAVVYSVLKFGFQGYSVLIYKRNVYISIILILIFKLFFFTFFKCHFTLRNSMAFCHENIP